MTGLKKLLLVGTASLTLIVAATAVILSTIDLDAFMAEQKANVVKQASSVLGRELKLGAIKTSVFPRLEARMSDVELAGAKDSGKAQASLASLVVKVDLWRAITSLGKDLHVDEVVLRGLVIRVARDAEGRWDFDDIQQRLKSGAPAEEEKEATSPPQDLSFLEGALLSRAAIEGARLEIDDAALGRPLVLDDFNLELTNVALGEPINLKLRSFFVDGRTRTPIAIDVNVSELRKDLSFDPMPDTTLNVKMGRLALAPWGGLMPRAALRPVAGTLEIELATEILRGLQRIETKGSIDLRNVVLRQAKINGAALTLKIDVDADADLDQGPRISVRSLVAQGSGLDVNAKAEIKGTGASALKNAQVKVSVQDLAALLKVLPTNTELLPPELTLAGPIDVSLKGNAQTVNLTVNLDQAHVAWADVFNKKTGRPLNLTLKGENKGDTLEIPAFALQVDAIKLQGSLGLPLKPGGPVAAKISSGAIPFSTLRQLLPPIDKALQAGDKVEGSFQIDANAKAVGTQQDASLKLALRDLNIKLEKLEVAGSGSLAATAKPQGDEITLSVEGNFDGLSLKSTDDKGQLVLNKPSAMPLRIDLRVLQAPKKTTIERAKLQFGKTKIDARGSITAPGTSEATLDLDFGALDISFADIRRTVPGAAQLPKQGFLRGKLKIQGNPERLGTLSIDARDLDLAFGKTLVKGRLSVKNLEQPVLDVDLPIVRLVFNDLRPLHPALAENLPPGGELRTSLAVSGDSEKRATLQADAKISKLVYGKLKARGTLGIKNLDQPQFSFDIESDKLNIDELLGEDKKGTKGSSKKAKPKKKEAASTRTNPHGLEPDVRAQLAKISGRGKLRVKKAIFSEMAMTNFVGDVEMDKGKLTFKALDFTLYDGRFSAAGTQLDLTPQHTIYRLAISTKKLNLGRAINEQTDLKNSFSGRVSQELKLSGRGLTKADLARSLTGSLVLNTKALTLKALDLLGPIGKQVTDALAGVGALTKFKGFKLPGGKKSGTALKDLQAFLTFDNGKFTFDKAVNAKTAFGAVAFTGGGKLDGTMDLTSTVKINPAIINKALGRKVVKKPVAIPLKIGGTWDKPKVTGIDARALVQSVAGGAAKEAFDALAAKAEAEKARLEAEAKKVKAEAERQARAAADRVQQQAQQQATRARQEAEQRTAQAQREAKRRAQEARARADAEAKRVRDAAKKKADAVKKAAANKARKAREKAERDAKAAAEKKKNDAAAAAKKKAKELKKKFGF